MISVGLVISSWFYWNKPFVHQPLTQLYLATLIDEHFKGAKVQAQVIDLRGLKKEFMSYHIPECDLFLYSVTSPDYFEVKFLVEELKHKYPKAKHVAGGAHVNIFPEESSAVFDTIVVGKGERSVIELINDFQNGHLKRIYNLKRDVNFTTYPFPRRDYLPKAAVVNTTLFKSRNIRSTSALFARGCPFRCNFCANLNPHKIQIQKFIKIKQEIEYLKKEYLIEGIALKDEVCIPINEEEAVSYLETVGSTNVKWKGQTRVGVSSRLIKLARESGCLELALGIESASQQVLDIANKKIKLDEVKNSIEICKKNGIRVQMCLIIGLPGEPQDIVSITKSFIEDTQPDVVMLAGFCPYPGSPVFNNPEYYGIKWIDHDYSKHSHLLHRFKDNNDDMETGIPFEYYPKNRWGKAFSRQEILNNLLELQDFLIEKGLNK